MNMGIEGITYKIDPTVWHYHGKTQLNLYAKKTVSQNGDLTTYTIQPIRSQIKLFAWLQERFEFFNKLVTWFLTRTLEKDQNCFVLKDLTFHPTKDRDSFTDDLMNCIMNNTDFFDFTDENDFKEDIKEDNWKNFKFDLGNNAYEIRISLSDVRRMPEKVLNAFYEQCFIQSPHMQTLKITALDEGQQESIAVDAGGLRRQFFTNLFNGLAEKTANGKSNYLAANPTSPSGWLPASSKKCRTDEEESLYVAIGKLMGMCLTSQGSLVIGQIFNPSIFDVIAQIPPRMLTNQFQDLDEKTKVSLYAALRKREGGDKLVEIYNIKNPRACSQEYLQEIAEYATICLELPEEMSKELENSPTKDVVIKHFHQIQLKIEEMLLEYVEENNALPLIFKIAQGIAWHLWDQDEWALHENSMTAWELDSKIQGLFNKELVKDAFRLGQDSDAYDYNRIKGFLARWIDESDEELVKKLVQATTGSATLGAEEKIFLAIHADTESLPSYHSCARQIDIGNFYDYDLFQEKLEKSLEYCDLNSFNLV
jgi:hypothetical protein